jgi:azurin
MKNGDRGLRWWATALLPPLLVGGYLLEPAGGRAAAGALQNDPARRFPAGRSVSVAPGEILQIRSVGVELSYDVTEIHAKSGETLTIRYDNTESEMAHNIVLVRGEEHIMPVGIAALRAHSNDYIPEDESDRILAYSEPVYPGETIEFTFEVPPPGAYPYICTYAGHFTMMQGRLISSE